MAKFSVLLSVHPVLLPLLSQVAAMRKTSGLFLLLLLLPLLSFLCSLIFSPLSLSLIKGFPGSSGWISISKPVAHSGRRADSHMAGWGISKARPLLHDWTHWLANAMSRACMLVCVCEQGRAGERDREHACARSPASPALWLMQSWKKNKHVCRSGRRETRCCCCTLGLVVTTLLLIGDLSVNPLQTGTHADAGRRRERDACGGGRVGSRGAARWDGN